MEIEIINKLILTQEVFSYKIKLKHNMLLIKLHHNTEFFFWKGCYEKSNPSCISTKNTKLTVDTCYELLCSKILEPFDIFQLIKNYIAGDCDPNIKISFPEKYGAEDSPLFIKISIISHSVGKTFENNNLIIQLDPHYIKDCIRTDLKINLAKKNFESLLETKTQSITQSITQLLDDYRYSINKLCNAYQYIKNSHDIKKSFAIKQQYTNILNLALKIKQLSASFELYVATKKELSLEEKIEQSENRQKDLLDQMTREKNEIEKENELQKKRREEKSALLKIMNEKQDLLDQMIKKRDELIKERDDINKQLDEKILLVSPDNNSIIKIWNILTGKISLEIETNSNINCASFSSDHTIIATGSNYGEITIWNADSGYIIKNIIDDNYPVKYIAFSHDNKLIVTCNNCCHLKIWDTETGALVIKTDCHNENNMFIQYFNSHLFCGMLHASFSSDDKLIVSADTNYNIAIWNASNGKFIRTLDNCTRWPRHTIFSPDNKYIASASYTIEIWDVQTGNMIKTFPTQSNPITRISYSSDGKNIVSGNDKGIIQIWNVETGEFIKEFHDHGRSIIHAHYSENNKFIISCDSSTICVRDIETENVIKRIYMY